MRKQSLVALLGTLFLWGLSPNLAKATSVTINDGNSSYVFSHEPDTAFGTPPFTGEWFVDGRRILTYVSFPANVIDVGGHHHPDSHVNSNQLHAAGAVLGGPPNGLDILGGIVYTLDGGAANTGVSRLTELVELTLGPSITSPMTVRLLGFGFEPEDVGEVTFEKPDLTGLRVTGTTLAFAQRGSFSSGPFHDLTVLPFHSFTGFNTFSEEILLNPDSTLIMITELNVSPLTGPNVGDVVPEPPTWMLMITGLVLLWRKLRRAEDRPPVSSAH